MKKLLLSIICLVGFGVARADFTSFSLTSQSDPLTYLPATSFTSNSLFVNFTGNSAGASNLTTDSGTNAIATFTFGTSGAITGDNILVQWIFGSTMSDVYETFPEFTFPGSVYLGSGAQNLTLSGNTLTIQNGTSGWSGATINGFLITDKSANPNNVPDGASTVLLLGSAFLALGLFARRFALVRQ